MQGVGRGAARARRDGVEVKILTGDNELVARHVCAQVGLDVPAHRAGRRDRAHDRRARSARVAERTTRLRPRLAGAEEPHHPGAQASRARGRLPRRRHQRRARRSTRPTSASPSRPPSTWPGTRPTSSCSRRSLRRPARRHHRGPAGFGNVMKYLLMGTSSNFGNMFSMAGRVALPAVPADAADADPAEQLPLRPRPGHDPDRQCRRGVHPEAAALEHRHHPALHAGDRAVSSLYDFLTFAVLLGSSTPPSRSSTRAGSSSRWPPRRSSSSSSARRATPWRSRPSRAAGGDHGLVVLIGVILPFTPLAGTLGFVPLPGAFFVFLGGATLTYLVLVEVVKRRLMRRLLVMSPASRRRNQSRHHHRFSCERRRSWRA